MMHNPSLTVGASLRLSIGTLVLALLLLAACTGPATTAAHLTATPTAAPPRSGTPTATAGPARYVAVTLARGFGGPDDLALDAQGRVIFADLGDGALHRIAPGGQVTTLLGGLPAPEGIVVLRDGAIIFGEQGGVDRVVRWAPGMSAPVVIVAFANHTGNPGLDGLGLDAATGDLLVPDSPNGIVLRVSQDGRHVTTIAAGFTRPTAAIAGPDGSVYVADEWGNAVDRVAPGGAVTKLATIATPDDLAFDRDGTLLVTSLGGQDVVRLDPATGRLLGTVIRGIQQPQGLAVDAAGNLYISDTSGNTITEWQRG